MANETESLMAFRKKYAGYAPWRLAKVRGEACLWEFTSFPWEEAGRVLVNARPISDSTGNRTFEVRKGIALCPWGHLRQRAYRDGFMHGTAWAIGEAKKYLRPA